MTEQTGPPLVALLSVDRPPVDALRSLGGAHPGEYDIAASVERTSSGSLRYLWPRGDRLELGLDGDGVEPLLAVQRAYGAAAVRDLLVLYLQTFMARGAAGESFWWWPEEHLELCGLRSVQRQLLLPTDDNYFSPSVSA